MEWGSVANWVAGIGSLTASCVALFISERNRRIELTGYVGKRVSIGGDWPQANLLMISVTNVGPRKARIVNVGFSFGPSKRRRSALITVGVPDHEHPWIYSDEVPIAINDGESATWCVHLDENDGWIVDMVREDFIETWKDVETLRFIIYTSQGYKKMIKPELEVVQQLHELVRRRALPQSTGAT